MESRGSFTFHLNRQPQKPTHKQPLPKLLLVLLLLVAMAGSPSAEASEPTTVDYLAQLNALVPREQDEALNAAPLYARAIESYFNAPIPLDAEDTKRWPTELTAERQQTLREWVSANSRALALLREGTRRPAYSFRYKGQRIFEIGPGDHPAEMRELFWALMFRAKCRAADGDISRAIDDILTGYRFGAHMKQRRLLAGQLVGLVMQSYPLEVTFQMLARVDIDVSQMESLQEGITRISSRADYLVGFAGEKLAALDAIQSVYAGYPSDHPVAPTKEAQEQARQISALLGKDMPAEQVHEALQYHTPDQLIDLVRRGYAHYDSIARKTPFEWRGEGIDFELDIRAFTEGNLLLLVLAPAVERASTLSFRCLVTRDALLTTLALLRYNHDKAKFPANLAQLVSAGSLEALPADPYSDGPLLYRRTESAFVLYSVGADFDDDGGTPSLWGQGETGGDQVFWPVRTQSTDRMPNVKVSKARRVFDNGEHNAFTDLVRFGGRFYLAFRSCPDGHMVHPSASIIILASTDAQQWEQVHRFSVPKRDTRDPHFLVFQDKLFVYTGTWYCGDTSPKRGDYDLNQHLGYAAWSADGTTWHSPIMLEGTFGHYIWRANTFGGKAYLCGRRKKAFAIPPRGEGSMVESALLESEDGLIWRTRSLFQEVRGDETAFQFESDGSIIAIGRRGRDHAQLLKAQKPYTQWQRTELDRYIGGPLLTRWAGRYVVGGRRALDDGKYQTSLCWLMGETLHEFARLPSGGDNSYPGFVELSPTRALVSWYSSHEKDPDGKTITAIYLADLEITD